MTNPELVSSSTTTYVPYFRTDDVYSITTEGQTVAVRLTGKENFLDTSQLDASVVSQYVRIQFFRVPVNGDDEQTY